MFVPMRVPGGMVWPSMIIGLKDASLGTSRQRVVFEGLLMRRVSSMQARR